MEKLVRKIFPKTVKGENFAGGVLWLVVVAFSTAVPALLLWLCYGIRPDHMLYNHYILQGYEML